MVTPKQKKKLTRNDLSKLIAPDVRTSSSSYKFVGSFFKILGDQIAEKGEVRIHGLGNFYCSDKSSRIGRNPKTGEESEITARRVVRFVAGRRLRQMMNDDL